MAVNMSNLKYTCINDLVQKAKINYVGKEPRFVYQRLHAMRESSDLAKKEGDDERAYIFLKRWLDSVEWLKRIHNKDGKSAYATNMTIDQINEVKNILADLKQKLEVRYDLNLKKCNDKLELMEVEMDESKMPNSDIGLKLPEIPAEDISLSSDNDNFISCDKLYNLIQKIRARYLIIDTRQKDHYENSRISSDRCINIPQSEIKKGLLGTHFEKYFANDKHSYDLFVNRSAQHTDILVLLDWNTTQETLTPCTHINLLKDIFEKWDPGIKHKKIKILNGGYQEWWERYPAFTTNPSIEVPEFKIVALDEKILDTFEYPSWACSDSEDEILKKEEEQETKNKLNNVISSNNGVDMEMDHGDNKSAISRHVRSNSNDIKSKNFISHVTISINDKRPSRSDSVNGKSPVRLESPESPVLTHSKILSSKVPQNEVSAKPVIDRSSKPTTLKTYDPRCKEVLRFMKELNELAKSKSKLATELLTHEYELYSQRENKYSPSDEKYLRTEIKSLKVKLEDMHKMYLKIENEFKTYLKETDTIKFNPTDDREKTNLDFNLSLLQKEIRDIETKRKKLQEDFLQREHKEILKNDSDVHKEPLKADGSSINTGLERSYSSPNLLQLGDRKAPQIDRTSKPHISPRNQNGIGNENIKVSSLSWGNREERMTPIHGTVHPGITGLKNLGNSCYMNSIIQCLSNTTNLAKYFTDNSYADDLNTNNDNMTQGQVVEEVAQVIKALWRGQYKSISPYDLKVAVGQYKLQFESYEQQDSHEFLTFLLDWMHNELKKDCMEKFVTGQKVSGWKCPKCQTPRDATKKFDFVKLAPIVVIHLNRFAESGGWLEKRNTAVDFPLTGFNLKPYLVLENTKAIMSNNIRNYNYTLYAISNHYGTMDGGHYTAFCKNSTQNKWYKYDDQTVTEVSPNQVKSQNTSAYLLFYTSFPNTIM
ncbi:PREDICTED: ubiquitin carboxyl-terminal hydrolase 8-like isoform X3 [Acromyrmex echinatior]|uniref:ubiquitin carboxyl-terminal hydrolase 8-like isoform X3 n=1 Tax=Acromyrmex echinatior TaxID=103372 RepID=UPI0005810451|nr:PREDICTED: ubiquitin carboxyl-terminal hydrolase 8-like isoform X3 [Acromyrmex echinatior]